MKFEIKARFTSSVLFTAELEARYESEPERIQMGAAVRLAYKSGAYLGGAYLRGAYLRGAYLLGADLRGAYLGGADLRGAYLLGADLGGADLRGAYLLGADLGGAYLLGADLGGADLRGAYLGGADLRGAYLLGADLGGADLRGIKITLLIARLTRTIEEYEFMAFRAEDGRCVVVAGCRGPWTTAEYRKHVKASYHKTEKADETLAILDFIDARDKADAKAAKNEPEAA